MGKPTVLMFPWLGSTPSLIAKYAKLYEDLDIRVKVKVPHILDFLWPKQGIQSALALLRDLENDLQNDQYPIIVHAMSIGCYFYNILIFIFETQPEKFAKVRQNICCQILDSPVIGTLQEMAKGSVKPITDSTKVQFCLEKLLLLYFTSSKPYTVWYYDSFIAAMKERPLYLPTLLMSCKGDPYSSEQHFRSLADSWSGKGFPLSVVVWENSEHCAHLKHYPQRYRDKLYDVLHHALPSVTKKSLL